jgi:DNA-binding NtrC family response regulator
MARESISLLVVDDEERMRSLLLTELRRRGHTVDEAASGQEALEKAKRRDYHVVLLDLRMPGLTGLETLRRLRETTSVPEVIIVTGHGTIDTAIEAMRLGAYHYVTKPFKLRELELHIRKAHEKVSLERKSRRLERLVKVGAGEPRIVGESPAMQRVLTVVAKVAPTESPVLITGESGSGKELVARAIHHQSLRSDAPFVVVNCATLQESLLETELFGHEKGAFTGAYRARDGLFEVAHHGTMFLDEVGEMPNSIQIKLLRVLQDGEVRRLGSNRSLRVDVRVIAATNVDLDEAVREKTFREDLFYRLNVLPVMVPPLRERREDIADLVRHMLSTISVPGRGPFEITDEALAALTRHSWPGNVRELMNTVERMKILTEGNLIRLADVPREVLFPESEPVSLDPETSLAELERRHILAVLRYTGGNKTRASAILGISTRTLYNRLAEYEKG